MKEESGAAKRNSFCQLLVTPSVSVTSGDFHGCAGRMEEVCRVALNRGGMYNSAHNIGWYV